MAARARADNDTLTLQALGEVSKALRAQNVAAAASLQVAPTKARKTTAGEREARCKEQFHKLHTLLLAPANMMAQMTCAVIFLRPGALLSEPTFAEGVRFFVYGGFGYLLPAAWLIFFNWNMLTREIRMLVAWIFLSVIGIGALLAWFEKQ